MKKSRKQKGKSAAKVDSHKRSLLWYAAGAAVVVVIVLVLAVFLSGQPAAKTGDTVRVYYTGTYENGSVFDSNIGGDPLVFTIGNQSMIPGFEEAVIGMTVNSTKTVEIPADKAYGAYQESLVQVVNRSDLPSGMEPEAGKSYIVRRSADNALVQVRITNVTSDTVTIDANPRLAGLNLTFTIQLTGIDRQ